MPAADADAAAEGMLAALRAMIIARLESPNVSERKQLFILRVRLGRRHGFFMGRWVLCWVDLRRVGR